MTFIKQDCAIAEHKLDVTVLIAINGIRLAVDCTKPGYTTKKTQHNNNQTTTTKTELASSDTSSFVEEKPHCYENETKCYKLFTCVFRLSSVPSVVV